MQLWELPERENSWNCSDYLFQTYPVGLQRWHGKKWVKNTSLAWPIYLRPHSQPKHIGDFTQKAVPALVKVT